MARNKPRKLAPVPVKQSPEKYLQTKARSLPVHECLINPDWQESGMATVLVSRKQPSGNIIVGLYLVDVLCLGLKITYFYFNQTARYYEEELKDILYQGQTYEPCDYVLAHNIVYGAIAYAEDLGFRPDKDFAVTRYILEEDDESVELLELEFGRDGKPCFVAGPRDNVALVTGKLRAAVGEENFTVVYPGGYFGNEDAFGDDDYEDDEAECEDEEAFDEYEEVTEDTAAPQPDADSLPDSIHHNGYEITYKGRVLEQYREYSDQLGDQVVLLHQQVREEPEKAIPVLQELIAKFPKYPMLQNLLMVAYIHAGRTAEADEVTRQVYERFPDYLFGRLAYAEMFLRKSDLPRVAQILENKFDIKQLYPERNEFQVVEVISYAGLVAGYLIERGDLDQAQKQVDLLVELLPDHPTTRTMFDRLAEVRARKGVDLRNFLG